MRSAKRLAAGVALVFLMSWPVLGYCAGDPWYLDMEGHWAQSYVRVLWEEYVTDGQTSWMNPNVCWYLPDERCTRAQFTTLLCKVFSLPQRQPEVPTFPDVPKTYLLFWDKPGWPWIEGAYSGGITFVQRGEYFLPNNYITREDAVELLIRSLDLQEYASGLTQGEVNAALSRFYDWPYVSPARQRSMACAIILGIIQGYEDGSLRPYAAMTRAEAATVVARSSLIRMQARRDVFSPDGDGLEDTVEFDFTYLKNRGIASWQAVIMDANGTVVRQLAPTGVSGPPPATASWDGLDGKRYPAPAGTYYYQAIITDSRGRQFMSVRRSLELIRHSLTAWLDPPSCADGFTLTVSAAVTPKASIVTATFADGKTRALSSPGPGGVWRLGLTVGPYLPGGPQTVLVRAYFEDAFRETALSFTRIEELWLDPSLSPNPAAWGQTVLFTCRTSSTALSCEVTLFGATVGLTRGADGVWRGSSLVPWGLSPGFYPATFVARSSASSVQGIVSVQITGPNVTDLVYILSK